MTTILTRTCEITPYKTFEITRKCEFACCMWIYTLPEGWTDSCGKKKNEKWHFQNDHFEWFFLFTWVPMTTICGNCIVSDPTVLKTSCSLFMTGIKLSIMLIKAKFGPNPRPSLPLSVLPKWRARSRVFCRSKLSPCVFSIFFTQGAQTGARAVVETKGHIINYGRGGLTESFRIWKHM